MPAGALALFYTFSRSVTPFTAPFTAPSARRALSRAGSDVRAHGIEIMLPHASILLLHKETATDRNHHYMLQLHVQWGDGGWHNGQRGGFYGTTAVAMGWSGAKMHAGLRTLIAPRALRRRVMLDAPTFQGIHTLPFRNGAVRRGPVLRRLPRFESCKQARTERRTEQKREGMPERTLYLAWSRLSPTVQKRRLVAIPRRCAHTIAPRRSIERRFTMPASRGIHF